MSHALTTWQRLKQQPWGMGALVTVILYALIALAVWFNWLGGGWQITSSAFNQAPSWSHWLGTNAIGQDIAARAIQSTRVAFEVGLIVAVSATALGTLLGAIAGFWSQSWPDRLISWLLGVIDSIPFYLLVAAIAYAMQNHPWSMHLAMIVVFWTTTARLIRSEVIKLQSRAFIDAARCLGCGQARLLWQHLIPNCNHLILVQTTLVFIAAIKTEVILSFLGIGIQEGISWGLMIAEATQDIQAGHYLNFISASSLLFILVMAFNILSDALQDALNPHLSP